MSTFLTTVLLIAIVLHVLLVFVEVFGTHSNSHVSAAARYMSKGPLRDTFWGSFFVVGSLVPIVMLCIALFVSAVPSAQAALLGMAGIFALAGLFAYEHCFVVAGQSVPLS